MSQTQPVELASNIVTWIAATGGTLEVVNSRTALVVNKHWILILGLLGRYGERVDKGILQRKGVRRNFDGERASIWHFTLPRKTKRKDFERPFEWVRKKQTRSTSRRKSRRSFSRSSGSARFWSDSDSESDSTVVAVRRSAYGAITLETTPQPTLYGITGKMQQLGRHKGSWSYLTAISFVPDIAKEIFKEDIGERREDASLQTLFWLAHGFLPCGRTADGQQSFISLEAPEPHIEMMGRDIDHVLVCPAYSLQESDDISISIGIAMQCLGIPEPQILQFLPIDNASRSRRMLDVLKAEEKEAIDLHGLQYDTQNGNFEKRPHSPSEVFGLSLDGDWVRYSNPSRDFFYWDNWGFLIWKDRFWVSILRDAVGILNMKEICHSSFGQSFGLSCYSRVFEWKHDRTFYAQKLADQLSLDMFLTDYLETYDLIPLRLPLGILFIMDDSLRKKTLRSCTRLSRLYDNDELYAEEEISELEQALKEVEAEYWSQKEIHKDDEIPFVAHNTNSHGQIVTHLVMEFLDTETMDSFHIHYKEAGSGYYRISGHVAAW
ncbi:hypothetical protein FLAG1_09803 [Fusarium langsethiae]|uniref:Uncharacterized protein n=1 Tax=Fusarium langsethiae TaxID=179993 RepID=A0A0N0V5E8_FUSLA|nr:hypothetical protein FLAG1_09803 [Fusarium langsethiae]GKU06920.1 unnamed protein product [Fusarium langsethiae]GKU22182.1 unnamed protein product [Fusarium langsethiae]